MTNIVYRRVKGSPLTSSEIDNNFEILKNQTDQVYSDLTQLEGNLTASDGSSLVGFQQAGTGAVVRTAQDKLRESVSVKDFGAVGDGIADDTTKLQSALNTVGVTSSGVYFPAGNYKVSGTLTISGKSNFSIFGPGRITQSAANARTLVLTSCTNFKVSGIYLYGYGADFVPFSPTLGVGLRCFNCSDFIIENNTFRNFGMSAIQCSKSSARFSISNNTIEGTDQLGTNISSGDREQFGIWMSSGDDVTSGALSWPCIDFVISGNKISNTAIGVRVEPSSLRYTISDNVLSNILGQHGMYLNGTRYTVSGNTLQSISYTGIKNQCFYLAGFVPNEGIAYATITGNTIVGARDGITVEKTDATANNAEFVTISGNSCFGISTTGNGIYLADTREALVANNNVSGGNRGILATVTTAGQGVNGRISGNVVSDTQWSAIFAYAFQSLCVSGNQVIRPCLAATTGAAAESAIFAASSDAATHRVEITGNTLYTGSSTGVVYGIDLANVDVWLGDNDIESKLERFSSCTLRKRTVYGDFVGSAVWTGGTGTLADGASATLAITVTGAAVGDFCTALSYNQPLQGCSMSGYISAADTLTVVITNNTGGSKTIDAGTVRYAVMKFGM